MTVEVEVTGDLFGLLQTRIIQLATDGALSSTLHGSGVVMCTPQSGVVVKASMSYVALDSDPAVPEQIARLLAAWPLAGWRGTVWSAVDSSSVLWRSFTTLPRSDTMLSALFRALADTIGANALKEIWQPAQHNTLWTDAVAKMKSAAHQVAQRSL